ncbi:MAG: RNA polymerase-associated protein RapA [Terrimicrobiaceae bacterium]
MGKFIKGQRWVSEPEPELGVGVVVEEAPERVSIFFPASGTIRQYAATFAPVKRVEFRAGDTIKTHAGESVAVESVEIREGGIFYYLGGGREVPETDLSDTLGFSKPEERLFVGQVDDPGVFDLRLACLKRRHQIRQAPVHGFLGARIDLIPHQLHIANEVASRLLPRVLLADEVGLGKTIEACLVVHRLFRSGRAKRILILVPEPLVHQWFVELLRRFNLQFSIFDEDRCRAIESGDAEANPFLDDQLILCPIGLLASDENRGNQAAVAGWDLVVVDEAHHLEWSPAGAGPEYLVVEKISARVPGLILLTATPEQLGTEGHFARLRLLDPDRYDDFQKFTAGRGAYRRTAGLAAKLLDDKTLTAADLKALEKICEANPLRLKENLAAIKRGDAGARSAVVQELLDQHGPGRVMFRNTRSAMKGFPKRKVFLEPLASDPASAAKEWAADHAPSPRNYSLTKDKRIDWLVQFLEKKRKEKLLLICRTREKVLAIEAELRSRISVKAALFHEELTLLQRDRNAAWFAEEDGAQILLCSEIGSEGRNFQFAHHLVLFDLPVHPDLLEQRIGRLDRIGQTETIKIHVPYPEDSPMAFLARWYHEGLNAFEKSLVGGREVMTHFAPRLAAFLDGTGKESLDSFVIETREFHEGIAKELKQGQDRLLQMNSSGAAKDLISQIEAWDADTSVDEFLLSLFDCYGVQVEELSSRTFLAMPGPLTKDAFPGLPETGITLTSDRTKALSREEIGFLTWDHPIVSAAIDLLMSSESGNCSFALSRGPAGIFLETVFVIEPVAPPALHLDRFLPPTPVRIVVDSTGKPTDLPETTLHAGPIFPLLDNPRIKKKLLPSMLEKSREHATMQSAILTKLAAERMQTVLGRESQRLKDLKKINNHIREEEITLLESQMTELHTLIAGAPVRLDAMRLVWQTPEE